MREVDTTLEGRISHLWSPPAEVEGVLGYLPPGSLQRSIAEVVAREAQHGRDDVIFLAPAEANGDIGPDSMNSFKVAMRGMLTFGVDLLADPEKHIDGSHYGAAMRELFSNPDGIERACAVAARNDGSRLGVDDAALRFGRAFDGRDVRLRVDEERFILSLLEK